MGCVADIRQRPISAANGASALLRGLVIPLVIPVISRRPNSSAMGLAPAP
jgi:hypothetical protein